MEVKIVEIHTSVYLYEPVRKLVNMLMYDEEASQKAVINKAIIEYAKKKLKEGLNKEYMREAIEEYIEKAEEVIELASKKRRA